MSEWLKYLDNDRTMRDLCTAIHEQYTSFSLEAIKNRYLSENWLGPTRDLQKPDISAVLEIPLAERLTKVLYIYVPEHTTFSLRLNKLSYLYPPPEPQQPVILVEGDEISDYAGQKKVAWRRAITLSPHQIHVIPNDTTFAIINPGIEQFYTTLITETPTSPPEYPLTNPPDVEELMKNQKKEVREIALYDSLY